MMAYDVWETVPKLLVGSVIDSKATIDLNLQVAGRCSRLDHNIIYNLSRCFQSGKMGGINLQGHFNGRS
jgi:hypothetical protein